MRLTRRERELLGALAQGGSLKAHRDLEGRKVYLLRRPDGAAETVSEADVHRLVDSRLLDSNKKFPAATFFLTDRAVAVLGRASAGPPPKGLVATSLPPEGRSAGR